MAEAENQNAPHSKRKAVATLLPYAIWLEQDGQPEMFLHTARVLGMLGPMWCHVNDITHMLLHKASPRAIVLMSPHISWHQLTGGRDLVQLWVAAASTVQYSEEVAQCVVDTLLWIASKEELLPHITVNVWLWLKKQPSLPPICWGRCYGSCPLVIKAVQGLGDIEILKSYLLLVWSEWYMLWDEGFKEMCTLIHENFSGIGMGNHQIDLIQRLDQILRQLDKGFDYLHQHNPNLLGYHLQGMKGQYGKLRDMLVEMNMKEISRMSYLTTMFPYILTQVKYTGPHTTFVVVNQDNTERDF